MCKGEADFETWFQGLLYVIELAKGMDTPTLVIGAEVEGWGGGGGGGGSKGGDSYGGQSSNSWPQSAAVSAIAGVSE